MKNRILAYIITLVLCFSLMPNTVWAADRDFVIELAGCLSLVMMHLSRFSEELILWSSHEFSFVEMDDASLSWRPDFGVGRFVWSATQRQV